MRAASITEPSASTNCSDENGVAGRAVPQPVAARTVQRQDAAHRRDVGSGGIRAHRSGRGRPRNRFSKAQPLPAAPAPSRASQARMRRMECEKSTTSPGPIDSPASPVPAPRAWSGISFSAAYCTQATTSARLRGRTTPSGRISYTLASEAYICTKTSSQKTSPSSNPRKSAWIRSRSWSMGGRVHRAEWENMPDVANRLPRTVAHRRQRLSNRRGPRRAPTIVGIPSWSAGA